MHRLSISLIRHQATPAFPCYGTIAGIVDARSASGRVFCWENCREAFCAAENAVEWRGR